MSSGGQAVPVGDDAAPPEPSNVKRARDWRDLTRRAWGGWVGYNARRGPLVAFALAPAWIMPVVIWWSACRRCSLKLEWMEHCGLVFVYPDPRTMRTVEITCWLAARPGHIAAIGGVAIIGALLWCWRTRPTAFVLALLHLAALWVVALQFESMARRLDGKLTAW